jgi:hypothetical protein
MQVLAASLNSQEVLIYQKDLGDDTANAASKLTTNNPDQSWSVVE